MAALAGMDTCATPWYVAQVPGGREQYLATLLARMAREGVVEECFTPRYATQQKRAGEWIDVEKVLLPGYIIVATRDVGSVVRTMRAIPEFTRLLAVGEFFVPLADDERAWIEAFTSRDDRCVAMSEGVMEGDQVVVLKGPLKGREALITRVNRHKNIAFVELEFCGRKVRTKVGLGIVGRATGKPAAGEHERA